MVRKIAIILFSVVGSCLLMTCALGAIGWYVQPNTSAQSKNAVKLISEQHLGGIPLQEPLSGAPAGSYLEIFDAVLSDGSKERRALVKFSNGTVQQLGPFTYQFPDTPIQTIILRAGNSRLIIGSVDEQLRDKVQFVVGARSGFQYRQSSDYTQVSAIGQGVFFIPIRSNEVNDWKSVVYFELQSHASRARALENLGKAGEWEKLYSPEVQLAPLLVDVDQRLAQKPTKQ